MSTPSTHASRVAVLLPLLLLLLLLQQPRPTAGAIGLISDETTMLVVNGEMRAERVVTVLCPSTDWGVANNQTLELRSPRNTTEEVAFVCGAYSTAYQGFVAGYVPARGLLNEVQVCARRQYDRSAEELRRAQYSVFNFTREEAWGPLAAAQDKYDRAFRAMKLQAVHNAVRVHGTGATREHIRGFESSIALQSSLNPFKGNYYNRANTLRRNVLNAFPKYGAMANAVIDLFGGGGNPNAELEKAIDNLKDRQRSIENAYTRLDNRLEEYQVALTNVQRDLVAYTGATETLIMGVAAQANIAQETAEAVGTQVVALREEFTRTSDVQARMISTLKESTNVLAGQVTAVYNTIGEVNDLVADLGAGVDMEFRRVYATIANATLRSHEALREVTESINNNALTTDDSVRRLVRSIASTQAAMADGIEDTMVMRSLIMLVHSNFASLVVNNTGLTPLLTDFGSAPDPFALMPDDTSSPMNDVEIIDLFVLPSAAPTSLVHQRIVLRCSVYFLLEHAKQVTGWRDVFDSIGSSKCQNATNGAQQLSDCACSVEFLTTTCTQASLGARTSFLTSPGVNGLTGALCNGGIVPPAVSQLISTPGDFTRALGATCQLGSSDPAGRIRIGSTLRRQMGFATSAPAACSLDFAAVREVIVPGMSLPFRVLQLLQYALQTGVTFASVYRPLVDGEMPAGLTYRNTPVSRQDGRNARCVTAAFMAYDLTPAAMLPVINYKAVTSGARASVWVNGVEYAATTTTVASFGLADAPSSFVSIGNPSSSLAVVDAPQHMLPLSTNPMARENSPLYAMFPTREANMSTWAAANGNMHFDAYAGSVDASSLQRSIDPVTRRCARTTGTPYALSQAGSVCELREFGVFTPAPSSASPHDVTYSPAPTTSNAAYIATFRVPLGDLVGVIYSACPAISVLSVSADVTRVLLTNGGRVPITVELRLSGRCVRDQRIKILPQTPFELDVRDCPNADFEGRETLIEVFDLDGRICEGFPRALTVERDTFIASNGNVDARWVNSVKRTIDYNIQDFVREQQRFFAEMMYNFQMTVVDMAVVNNLVMPELNVTRFDAITTQSDSIATAVQNRTDELAIKFEQFEISYEEYVEELELIRNQSASRWGEVAAIFEATKVAAAAAREQTALNLGASVMAREALNQSTLALLLAQAAVTNATLAIWLEQMDFNRGVISAFETLLGGDTPWWQIFVAILTFVVGVCVLFALANFVLRAWRAQKSNDYTKVSEVHHVRDAPHEVYMGGIDPHAEAGDAAPTHTGAYHPHDIYGRNVF